MQPWGILDEATNSWNALPCQLNQYMNDNNITDNSYINTNTKEVIILDKNFD